MAQMHKCDVVYIWFLQQEKFTIQKKGNSLIVSDVINGITCLEEFNLETSTVYDAKEWCYNLIHGLLHEPEGE